ncbi:MAG: cold shock domain-containing protein [Dinoroseobacter sp.]|nr:cold shock domain-containing protein [Dinoroseobacter sp.]MDJ0993261.1 cold shock domain-containing protein [Dinoroseobacter sp.]
MADSPTIDGTVKWFDPKKGFGFVVGEADGPDILLHANVLRNFGQSSVADGARIQIRVQETPRGIQATEVISISPPEGGDVMDGEVAVAQSFDDLPIMPGRVKWFDKIKGFGFVNVFGAGDDIFVHMDVLRRCGFSDLQAGEAVALRVGDSDRGRLALEVLSWDAAIDEE